MTAQICDCCKEDGGAWDTFDPDLGVMCEDCAEGILIARPSLIASGIVGVYRGPCADNDGGQP